MAKPTGNPLRKRTVSGHDPWEVLSAMQKSVRRGLEMHAMEWILEAEASGLWFHVMNRLRVTAHEDIGLADPAAVLFAEGAIDRAMAWHKTGNEAWRIAAGNAVRALARASKSREGDHFQAAAQGARQVGPPLVMPDWALDKHTARGRKMGRGLEHFRKEGAKLEPPAEPDQYEEEAYKAWERAETNDAQSLPGMQADD